MRGLPGGGPPDDVDPFTPGEDDERTRPQSARSVDSTLLSRWLVPQSLARRAISVSIETPQAEYALGTAVPFRVTMTNPLPIPLTLLTRSPILWQWTVDGVVEASHIEQYDPPDEPGKLHFDRGERKRFTGEWSGKFRVTEREWEPAAPGEYAIGATINVDGERSPADECTVRLVE